MSKSNKSKVIQKHKEKADWDSTINDLKAYKATADDILERKLSHQSKYQNMPIDSAVMKPNKTDSVYDRLTKTRYGNKLKTNDINQRKELLSDMFIPDKELFDLFSQSEKALSNVENMFGNQNKRYRVVPTVTLAPDRSTQAKSSNNSNSCALNDHSDSEEEEQSSKDESRSIGQEDDLTKFRKFIENEKKINDSLQNKLDEKKTVLSDYVKKLDVGTETGAEDDADGILRYISGRLGVVAEGEVTISASSQTLSDGLVSLLQEREARTAEEIAGLRADLGSSRELIDALTLELINCGQQMKRLRSDTESFMNTVTKELSQMKTYVIKYFDQRENAKIETTSVTNKQASLHSILADQLFRDNLGLGSECKQQPERDGQPLAEQMRQLQMDHEQTQRRLKHLTKLQKSLTQRSGDVDR